MACSFHFDGALCGAEVGRFCIRSTDFLEVALSEDGAGSTPYTKFGSDLETADFTHAPVGYGKGYPPKIQVYPEPHNVTFGNGAAAMYVCMYVFIYLTSLLEYNCFTMVC